MFTLTYLQYHHISYIFILYLLSYVNALDAENIMVVKYLVCKYDRDKLHHVVVVDEYYHVVDDGDEYHDDDDDDGSHHCKNYLYNNYYYM